MAQAHDDSATGAGRRVLLVRGPGAERDALAGLLLQHGFLVQATTPNQDVEGFEPQLVVVDATGATAPEPGTLTGPGPSIEARHGAPTLVIHGDSEAARVALHHGVDDFLLRPFTPEELTLRLEVLWRVGRLHDRLRAANERVRALTTTDELTGLANRRAFEQRLEQELLRVPRFGIPVACVYFACDHLSRVRAAHGQAFHSQVVKELARTLVANVRDTDLIARHGDDVFAVALPGCVAAPAAATAERLRQLVSMTPVRMAEAEAWVTLSAGIAVSAPAHRVPGDELRARALAELARAQAAGHDRICVAESRGEGA